MLRSSKGIESAGWWYFRNALSPGISNGRYTVSLKVEADHEKYSGAIIENVFTFELLMRIRQR